MSNNINSYYDPDIILDYMLVDSEELSDLCGVSLESYMEVDIIDNHINISLDGIILRQFNKKDGELLCFFEKKESIHLQFIGKVILNEMINHYEDRYGNG